MASGYIDGNFTGGTDSGNFTLRLAWTATADPANNRSYVTLSWYLISKNYAVTTYKYNTGWTQTVDGNSTSGNTDFNYPNPVSIPKQTPKLFRSDSMYISHGGDGNKMCSVSGTMNLSGTSAGTGSLSGTMVFDHIATTPPTIDSFTLTEIGTAYGAVGAYVAGFTKFRFSVSVTQGDSAIASYAFYRGSTLLGTVTTSNTSVTFDMTAFETAGTYVYSVVVTDAYNLSATANSASTVINAYTMPTISATTFRCNSGGTQDNEGTYGKVDMTWTVANVGTNTATVHKCTISGSTYTTFPQIKSGLLTTQSYDAVYVVTDSLGKSATITQTVQVSFINMDMYPSSNGGVAFGEAAQENKFIVNQSETILRGSLKLGSPLAKSYGGTGASSGTQFNNAIAKAVYEKTFEYTTNTTSNTTSAVQKSYTSQGSSVVNINASVWCDATNDGGDFVGIIYKNDVAIAVNQWGFPSGQTKAQNFGISVSATTKVLANDVIKIHLHATKSGDKTFYYNVVSTGYALTAS